MRVAVVGGTGSFGTAVAKRLVDAGVEVVIGSREAARAREAAEPLGAEGANNDDAVRGADLVLFAVKADAAVETARDLRPSIGSTPVLSVCSELSFGPSGVRPTAEATSIAQRIQDELDAPVVAGLHSLAASNLAEAPPDEDALVCGDDAVAKGLALDLVQAHDPALGLRDDLLCDHEHVCVLEAASTVGRVGQERDEIVAVLDLGDAFERDDPDAWAHGRPVTRSPA